MINFCWKNVDSSVIGPEHGLNVQKEFDNYKEKISEIISKLYASKDIEGNWLKWMNLGNNQKLVKEINAYTDLVKNKFEKFYSATTSNSISTVFPLPKSIEALCVPSSLTSSRIVILLRSIS